MVVLFEFPIGLILWKSKRKKIKIHSIPIHYPTLCFPCDDVQYVVQYLLQSSVLYSNSDKTIGSLFMMHPIITNKLVLNSMVDQVGLLKSWDCIERVLSQQKWTGWFALNITSGNKTYTSVFFRSLSNAFQLTTRKRDRNNHLPIHLVLDEGMEWSPELAHLLTTSYTRNNIWKILIQL